MEGHIKLCLQFLEGVMFSCGVLKYFGLGRGLPTLVFSYLLGLFFVSPGMFFQQGFFIP